MWHYGAMRKKVSEQKKPRQTDGHRQALTGPSDMAEMTSVPLRAAYAFYLQML